MLRESGIPLTIGIWNPSLTDMESTLKIQNPRQFWIRAFCLTLSAAIPILIATKRGFEIQKELNSHRTGLEKQQGLRFIVFVGDENKNYFKREHLYKNKFSLPL